jgi:hypothetical protein
VTITDEWSPRERVGAAIDVIRAVGELVETDDGPPKSGTWSPLTTCHIAGVEDPARMGDSYPWHNTRVEGAPQLFLPADALAEVIEQAIDDYRAAAQSPRPAHDKPLKPGPGVSKPQGASSVGLATALRSPWHAVSWPGPTCRTSDDGRTTSSRQSAREGRRPNRQEVVARHPIISSSARGDVPHRNGHQGTPTVSVRSGFHSLT